MREYPPPAVQHCCNAAALYCRMRDQGMPHDDAHTWSKLIESVLHPHLYPHVEFPMPKSKSVFESSTVWFNVLSIVIWVVATYADLFKIPAEYAAVFVAIGNIVLRVFKTGQPVSITGKPMAWALVLSLSVVASGCSGMTAEQAARARAALEGAAVLAGAVSAMPVPPGMEEAAWAKQSKYWSSYASGVLKATSEVAKQAPFGSAAPSPAVVPSSTKAE